MYSMRTFCNSIMTDVEFEKFEKCNYHYFVENMNFIQWERNVSSDKNILEQ